MLKSSINKAIKVNFLLLYNYITDITGVGFNRREELE